MKNKKVITLSVLFLLIVAGGKYSTDRYIQYRADRYQTCYADREEIVYKNNTNKTIKAKAESGHFDDLSPEKMLELSREEILIHNNDKPLKPLINHSNIQKKTTENQNLFSMYNGVPSSILDYDDKEKYHPCIWLEKYYQETNPRSATATGSK